MPPTSLATQSTPGRHQPGQGDPAGQNIASTASERRERKRQTDRVAQQQHRKRQKKYIEELEHKLGVLQSGDQSEIVRLGTENFRLRQTLKSLHELWGEMEPLLRRHQEIVAESGFAELFAKPTSASPPRDAHNYDGDAPAILASGDLDASVNSSDPEADAVQEVPPEAEDDMSQQQFMASILDLDDTSGTQFGHTPAEALPEFGFDMQLGVDNMLDKAGTNVDTTFGSSHVRASTMPDMLSDSWPTFLRAVSDDWLTQVNGGRLQAPRQNNQSKPTTSWKPTNSGHIGGRSDMAIDTGTKNRYEAKATPHGTHFSSQPIEDAIPRLLNTNTFQSIPSIPTPLWQSQNFNPPRSDSPCPVPLSPASQQDQLVHEIIERARANIDDIGPPNLLEFLLHNPRNTLSVDLKNYLEPVRKAKGTSEYLATYWVLYLLMRWYILPTNETYQSLPHWLRPTPMQFSVLHPVCADLIAWPGIREAMIATFQTDSKSMHKVALDIGTHLTVNIKTNHLDFHTGPVDIAAQITDLSNWTLDGGFFDSYPQWREMMK